jgi:hypothetical protein
MTGCTYIDETAGIDSTDPNHQEELAQKMRAYRFDALMDWSDSELDKPWAWDAGGHVERTVAAPQPIPTPTPAPAPPSTPVFPVRGYARTVADLNLRTGPSTDEAIIVTMPIGTRVRLTGGLFGPWRSVSWRRHRETLSGWCHSSWLVVSAIIVGDNAVSPFPAFTHVRRWHLDNADTYKPDEVRAWLDGIYTDIRGLQRTGCKLEYVATPGSAHTLIELHPDPCGGAAGCWMSRSGQQPRIQIGTRYYKTANGIRPPNHEYGHDLFHFHDHYRTAPRYPRAIKSFMSDWFDAEGGFHGWPDVDDVAAGVDSLHGRFDLVYSRDMA